MYVCPQLTGTVVSEGLLELVSCETKNTPKTWSVFLRSSTLIETFLNFKVAFFIVAAHIKREQGLDRGLTVVCSMTRNIREGGVGWSGWGGGWASMWHRGLVH